MAKGNGAARTVKFTLDGRAVEARAGETIWQVAKREGVDIPHLCYSPEPGYRADGNCRACMVEIEGERVLVLGDMGEVGARGPEFHREVGAHARERGIDALVALGPMARDAADAFGARAVHCTDIHSLLAVLRPRLGPSVTVLVKGSRFMRMERVVQALAAAQPEGVH